MATCRASDNLLPAQTQTSALILSLERIQFLAITLLSVFSLTFVSSNPAYALSSEPPWGELSSANGALALDGSFNQSFATDTLLGVSFPPYNRDLLVSASVEPIGLSSTLDGAACPTDGLSLLIARGSVLEPLTGTNGVVCNSTTIAQGLGGSCDFDQDSCPEYEVNSSTDFRALQVDFAFQNITATSNLYSTTIEVPQEILEAMRDSAVGNLSISINGNVLVTKRFDNTQRSGSDCAANLFLVSAQVPLSVQSSFGTYGTHYLFFLRSPILGEQWFRNNRFDTIVLSQAPLYQAGIDFNNHSIWNGSMSGFDVIEGKYGMKQAISIPYQQYLNLTANQTGQNQNASNQTGNSSNQSASQISLPPRASWSESISNGSFSPSSIDPANRSYIYVYQFDSSYDGIGPNNLSITVRDSCGGSGSFNGTINSRMLSYGGTNLENGSPINLSISRPSAGFNEDILSRSEISMGLVAVVVLLAFINFWALR